MKIIGITGSIGSGKSTVAEYLKYRSFDVFDADQVSREMTGEKGKALKSIREAFGNKVFLKDGNLDRKKMAEIVFNDTKAKAKLEEIVTYKVVAAMKRWIAAKKKEGKAKVVFLDVPLLFETGAQKLADEVWVIACDDNIRMDRILKRGGLTKKEAKARIKSQMPQEEKILLSDVVIYNNGSREQLLRKLRRLLKEYK